MSQRILENILGALPRLPSQIEPAAYCADDGAPPFVLHIDDDAEFSRDLKVQLESHGVAVVRAYDGKDGVRHAQKYRADAILLDVEMPNGSGDEVLRVLKSSDRTEEIPVVVVTCPSSEAMRPKMLALGATAFLTKPVVFQDLQRELSQHINILSRPARRDAVETCPA